jgi:restriction system protein
MLKFPSPDKISPLEFELLVKQWLEASSPKLQDFTVQHRVTKKGVDGDYEIDAFATFTALGGAIFKVLVECKRHSNPIKREVIQALSDKRRSIGATKAMLVSTAPFQSGAIDYARVNDVALVEVVSGSARYVQASTRSPQDLLKNILSMQDAEPYVGFFYCPDPSGRLLSPHLLAKYLLFELDRYFEVNSASQAVSAGKA